MSLHLLTSIDQEVHLDFDRLQVEKARLLREGRNILDLSMINPDLAPPRILLDRLVEATLRPSHHRYAVSRGVRKLRDSFAVKYQDAFSVRLDPDREICVTFGSKDGIFSLLFGRQRKVKSVILPSPTYPAHRSAAELSGFAVRYFEVHPDEADTFRALEEVVLKNPGQIVLLNFPNNPTGCVVSTAFWEQVDTLATRTQSLVVNDFVYGEVGFEAQYPPSMLSACTAKTDRIELYSMSKAYSIPGWRVAAAVGDSEIIAELSTLKAHLDYGNFLPLQLSAAVALSSGPGVVHPIVAAYRERASALCRGLEQGGWTVRSPKAGCSVWAQLPAEYERESAEFLEKLLIEEGIAIAPGTYFGAQWGRWVRFALVASPDKLERVVERSSAVLRH